MNAQVNQYRPQQTMNALNQNPSYVHYMPIPNYMQNMPGYNMSNMPTAFRAGYQTLNNRQPRFLEQNKYRNQDKKSEKMIKAFEKRILGMKKLINSMNDNSKQDSGKKELNDVNGHTETIGKRALNDKSEKIGEMLGKALKQKILKNY